MKIKVNDVEIEVPDNAEVVVKDGRVTIRQAKDREPVELVPPVKVNLQLSGPETSEFFYGRCVPTKVD